MTMSRPRTDIEDTLSSDYLNSIYRYDADTGKLYHKRKGVGIQHEMEAGTRSRYVLVKIAGRQYRAHRVIWCMVYGSWPKELIDHINRNPLDNRLTNIREATRSQNGMNTTRPPSNTNHRNISYVASKDSYRVRMRSGGERHQAYRKSFDDAVAVAKVMREELQGVFSES